MDVRNKLVSGLAPAKALGHEARRPALASLPSESRHHRQRSPAPAPPLPRDTHTRPGGRRPAC